MTFQPYIPFALWVLLAVAGAALLTWYAMAARRRLPRGRRAIVVGLMAVAVAIPLAVLLNPIWLERIPPPAGKPLLTVLVDRSASMATPDADDGRARYDAARSVAGRVAESLGERFEVRTVSFAADSADRSPEELGTLSADGAATDLAAAIEDALDDDRPQGQAMLLVSDGIHNAGGGMARLWEAAAKAKATAAPIYAAVIGGEGRVNDLEVAVNLPQELAFVGQRVPVAVTLRQRGSLAAQTNVSLLLGGEVVEARDVALAHDGTVEEVFYVTQQETGQYGYELRAEPLPGEVTDVNNASSLLLRVVDQPVGVLVLEGKPYWDTKFLIRTLSTDKSIELTSVVRMAEGRFLRRTISHAATPADGGPADGGPLDNSNGSSGGESSGAAATDETATTETEATQSAPSPEARTDDWTVVTDGDGILGDAEALSRYRIVVLGRDADVFLTDEALVRVKKWLAAGDGSLVCFRGPPSSQISRRLGQLMPVRWSRTRESRFRMEMTGAGRALRWLPAAAGGDPLPTLPSLASVARAEDPKPLAVVLATAVAPEGGQVVPAITYQPVGNGRVVVVEGAGMWRWAFLPIEHKQHDAAYGTLWRSLVRWLVANAGLLPSQQLALRTDKVTFSTTENVAATLLVRQDKATEEMPQVELTGGDLQQPQRIAATAVGTQPGQYAVAIGRLPEGRYRARVLDSDDDVSAVASFDVRGNLKERLDVAARPSVMKRVAQQSGGAVLDLEQPSGLARQFETHLARSRPERLARTTAWDRWWILTAAFCLWAATWGLRRSSGLV